MGGYNYWRKRSAEWYFLYYVHDFDLVFTSIPVNQKYFNIHSFHNVNSRIIYNQFVSCYC